MPLFDLMFLLSSFLVALLISSSFLLNLRLLLVFRLLRLFVFFLRRLLVFRLLRFLYFLLRVLPPRRVISITCGAPLLILLLPRLPITAPVVYSQQAPIAVPAIAPFAAAAPATVPVTSGAPHTAAAPTPAPHSAAAALGFLTKVLYTLCGTVGYRAILFNSNS